MRKYLLTAALCISLGACTQLQNITNAVQVAAGTAVTAGDVYEAANAFDAAEQTGINYLHLPLCNGSGNTVCRVQGTSVVVANLINKGLQARKALLAQVQSANGQPVSTTALNAFKTLVSQLVTAVGGV